MLPENTIPFLGPQAEKAAQGRPFSTKKPSVKEGFLFSVESD